MKIFHLSDLHIGIKLYNRDLYEDQKYIFEQIVEHAANERPDAVIIAGDIYDKAIPPVESVELFDWFIYSLTNAAHDAEIMMISGNHDSAPRINIFRKLLRHNKVHMIGIAPCKEGEYIEKLTLKDEYGNVNFYLLPFVKPSMVREIVGTDDNGNNLTYNAAVHKLISRETINEAERNVLVSHQFYLPRGVNADKIERSEIEMKTAGNIDAVDADILECFDYAALGHVHKPMKVGSESIRYCGTPMQYSVSEAGQKKSILVAELAEKGTIKTRNIPLIPIRQIRIIEGTLEEVLEKPCTDYVDVRLIDKVDLDIIDMQDRLRSAFPYLLTVRRTVSGFSGYSADIIEADELDELKLCMDFLNNPEDDDIELLNDVLNTVKGAGR